MIQPTLKQKVIKIDNKMTYVVGYRNAYNFCVMMVASMAYLYGEASMNNNYYVIALILFVMAGKWFLTQARENIDAMDAVDAMMDDDQPDVCNCPTSKDILRI